MNATRRISRARDEARRLLDQCQFDLTELEEALNGLAGLFFCRGGADSARTTKRRGGDLQTDEKNRTEGEEESRGRLDCDLD